ncbi:MAG: monooxygenase [Myxococcales bacterium]|nr:monooxygenase [Myxococcales bacterium]
MTRRPATLPLLVALFIACGDDGGATSATAGSTSTGDSTTTTTAATTTGGGSTSGSSSEGSSGSGGEPALTYYRDIKAILDAKCANCHKPGDIAPFSLTTYDEAAMWAPIFGEIIEAREMPPWGADAACRSYKHDASLTDEELAMTLAWIDLGAPEGDPADAPPPPEPPPAIDYDVELQLPEPFAPTVYPDEYRCFLSPWPAAEERFVTAFDIEPGERSIVHHVIVYVIPPDQVDTYTALDDADPGPGYPCFGGPGGEKIPRAQWLGAWAPGFPGGALPEGTGIGVAPGSLVALQVHYHPVQGAAPDLSKIHIRTAPSVDRPAYLMPIANPLWMLGVQPMTIPAGASDVTHFFDIDVPSAIDFLFPDSTWGKDGPVLAWAAGVHMHNLGTEASVIVQRQDGDECLVDVPRWDFNWQATYEFSEPTLIDPKDTLHLECHFNNAAGDKTVAWGDGTGDEMCLGIVYVSAP